MTRGIRELLVPTPSPSVGDVVHVVDTRRRPVMSTRTVWAACVRVEVRPQMRWRERDYTPRRHVGHIPV